MNEDFFNGFDIPDYLDEDTLNFLKGKQPVPSLYGGKDIDSTKYEYITVPRVVLTAVLENERTIIETLIQIITEAYPPEKQDAEVKLALSQYQQRLTINLLYSLFSESIPTVPMPEEYKQDGQG